jgi:hypothetical protein
MNAKVPNRSLQAAVLAAAVAASTSCGDVARTGRSPVLLVIETVEAASGADPNTFSQVLLSDVQTIVERSVGGETQQVPTVFNDLGRATFRLVMKNPGVPESPLNPTALNEVTLTRYRVAFRRSDGRNTPGVDVPFSFDGAMTITVPASGNVTAGFDLVRHQMKLEPPLRNLVNGGGEMFISTVAEVTFWGRDQAGNEISATATITVNFGDFADPR